MNRRSARTQGRAVRAALLKASDALDVLLEDAGEAITLAERVALREANEHVLHAFRAINDADDLTSASPLPREVTG